MPNNELDTLLGAIQANSLHTRLVSRGGRPSDPNWEIKRLVPFTRANWNMLTNLSRSLGNSERKIGPAQLSAMIIEKGLAAHTGVGTGPKLKVNVGNDLPDWLMTNNTTGHVFAHVELRPPKTSAAFSRRVEESQAGFMGRGTGNYFRVNQQAME